MEPTQLFRCWQKFCVELSVLLFRQIGVQQEYHLDWGLLLYKKVYFFLYIFSTYSWTLQKTYNMGLYQHYMVYTGFLTQNVNKIKYYMCKMKADVKLLPFSRSVVTFQVLFQLGHLSSMHICMHSRADPSHPIQFCFSWRQYVLCAAESVLSTVVGRVWIVYPCST